MDILSNIIICPALLRKYNSFKSLPVGKLGEILALNLQLKVCCKSVNILFLLHFNSSTICVSRFKTIILNDIYNHLLSVL